MAETDSKRKAAETAAAQAGFAPPRLPKRFYKTVAVAQAPPGGAAEAAKERDLKEQAERFTVLLDGKGVKTPARRALALPGRALAELIADEFRLQEKSINPAAMPVTRLANTVIDGIEADMQPVAEDILRRLAGDLVFYRAESPRELAERQRAAWDKALDWALQSMGAEFAAAPGIMPVSQKPAALAAANAYLRAWLAAQGEAAPFALAALHMMAGLSGSVLLAFMAAAGALSVAEAWAAAHIDEDWTNSQWGIDAAAAEARAARERDFYAAAAALAALKAQ